MSETMSPTMELAKQKVIGGGNKMAANIQQWNEKDVREMKSRLRRRDEMLEWLKKDRR